MYIYMIALKALVFWSIITDIKIMCFSIDKVYKIISIFYLYINIIL